MIQPVTSYLDDDYLDSLSDPEADVTEADNPAYDDDLSDLFFSEDDDLTDLAEVACLIRRYRDETALFDGE